MTTFKQVLRYGLVGVLINSVGYLVYLGITWLGAEPKLTVTILYPVGIFLGLLGHGSYSFSYRGRLSGRLPHFFTAQAIGYATNIGFLYWVHDWAGWSHQLTQLIAIIVVAGELFLLMRYLVFPQRITARNTQ